MILNDVKLPLVSIIIIGYNVENVIGKCIESVQNQTYSNIEIIVVDDGSKDSTSEVVNKFLENDKRMVLINQKNQGILAARKTGLQNSNGEYVTFVDSDDWLSANMIEKLLCAALDYSVDIVLSDNINVFGEKHIISKYNRCDFKKVYKGNDYLQLILKQKVVHNVFGKLYKKNFLLQSNYLSIENVSMGEDLLAQIYFAIKKPKVVVIDENLYYYVQDINSYSHNNSDKIFELVDVLNIIDNILIDNNLYEKYKDEVDFLWFVICYFYYVVLISRRKYLNKKFFYKKWKDKKVIINNNKLIKEYISNLNICNKLLVEIYNVSFFLGFLANSILSLILIIKKRISSFK